MNFAAAPAKWSGGDIVDYTASVYGKQTPVSVEQGKTAVLHVLARQSNFVKSVVFLENFNISKVETAVANGNLRCSGLAVVLDNQYRLSKDDNIWLNGLYGESTTVYPLSNPDAKLQKMSARMFEPNDSRMVAGIYEKAGYDELTGQSQTDRYCIINSSAGDLGRKLVSNWTRKNLSLRDAYENAATKALNSPDGTPYDNLNAFTSAIHQQLAGEFGALEPSLTQVSNTFIRGKSGSVVYMNGAVASSQGALCHVSPLHGFVKFPATESRLFYPSTLLSHQYVDVTALNTAQRNSIFKRAKWTEDTTVNPYALRKPISRWQAALPQPVESYRMNAAYFGCDERETAALPTSAILQMTPTAVHVAEVADVEHAYPAHVKQNKVRILADDVSVAKLVAMRNTYNILNENIYDGKYLNIPRDLAEQLVD